MEKKLRRLFDYQRFVRDEGLQMIIDGVEARCRSVELSYDELDLVAAAGIMEVKKPKLDNIEII